MSEPHLSERQMRQVLTISKNLLELPGTKDRRLRAESERADRGEHLSFSLTSAIHICKNLDIARVVIPGCPVHITQ